MLTLIPLAAIGAVLIYRTLYLALARTAFASRDQGKAAAFAYMSVAILALGARGAFTAELLITACAALAAQAGVCAVLALVRMTEIDS